MRFLLVSTALLLTFGGHVQDLKPAHKGNSPYNVANAIIGQHRPPAPTAGTPVSALARSNEYLFITWSLGILQPYNGPARRAWLMYNTITRQLVERVTKRKLDTPTAVDMDLLREFAVGDSSLNMRITYRRYLNTRVARASLRTAFYEVHYDAGRTALLCQRTHSLGQSPIDKGGFTGRYDILRYFIKNTDNQIIPVALSAKEIIAALEPAHTADLTAYAQAQHLDFEVEKDIVRLLAYHDSL
jgi:hypothetical protein